MKKNVLFIVIDGLSKWYIDQCKKNGSFFDKLEKTSYFTTNMFSEGPFTEAATRGLWASQGAMHGDGYLSETCFGCQPFYELFSKNDYYIYMGELIPFFSDKIHVDNKKGEEKGEVRGFDHLWRSRLQYFISLKREKKYKETDNCKIEFLLDHFFEAYKESITVECEKEKYCQNKEKYITDIIENGENSSLFMEMDSSLYKACYYKNITNYRNTCMNPISENEMKLVSLAKYKNLQFLFEMNQGDGAKKVIERELGGTDNRCINSNNDLISHMRGGYDDTPRLRQELKDFLDWLDNYKDNKPFLAYIHNFDFHYPENFINSKYNSTDYNGEIEGCIEKIKKIQNCNMSVSKQLSILNIESNLEEFWNQLSKRRIFDNTYVVLTADHGITNFMYPVERSNQERWNYTKTNFQVPFYIQGVDIVPVNDKQFRTAKDILPTLAYKCGMDLSDEPYEGKNMMQSIGSTSAVATWINGIPDLDRKKLRIGMRNEKYSITYEAYITQFLISGNAIGIYDLSNDSDEIINLAGRDIQDKDFLKLLYEMKNYWFETIFHLLTENNSIYQYTTKYQFLLDKCLYYKEYNQKIQKISWENANNILKNKQIILFGCGENCLSFISKKEFIYPVTEIWDNDPSKWGKYVIGHKVCKPNVESVKNDTVVIITNRYEIESVEQLNSMHVKNYYIGELFY